MNTPRRLYRCRDDRKVVGVAAGVAEFFDLDPSMVRVVWFLSIFFGGLGLFLYIAMALIVPLEPLSEETAEAVGDQMVAATAGHRHARHGGIRWSMYVGIVLILFGVAALVDSLVPGWDSWRYLGPAFVVGIGALLIGGAVRRESKQP